MNTQGDSTSSLPESGCVEQGFQTLEKVFDEQHGGFGAAPKFPQPGKYIVRCTCMYMCVLQLLYTYLHVHTYVP